MTHVVMMIVTFLNYFIQFHYDIDTVCSPMFSSNFFVCCILPPPQKKSKFGVSENILASTNLKFQPLLPFSYNMW